MASMNKPTYAAIMEHSPAKVRSISCTIHSVKQCVLVKCCASTTTVRSTGLVQCPVLQVRCILTMLPMR
jgi:hypothetical protein